MSAAPEPRANPRLLDQEAAERRLLEAERSGRLPHAWLIVGPRGIGKATLAFRFARHLLAGGLRDEGPGLFGDAPAEPSLALSPDHRIFHQVAAAGHPDLVTIAREADPKTGRVKRDISVDSVRKATDFLRLTSAEGGRRIVIVDSADEMNANAANALLKVLEEPPQAALLLLVSHSPGGLLPTIRSRCRQLALRPLPSGTVEGLLADFRPELDPADRHSLAVLSEGSIGRAETLAELGGLLLYRELLGYLEALPRLDVGRLHEFGERLARDSSGEAFRTVGELLERWLARLLRAGAGGELPPEVVPGEAEVIARLLQRGSLEAWLRLWEKLSRLFSRTESANLDRKQAILTAFLALQARAA
ncbi:DNA polymerase III, delta prime subunit [Tistlia consotensis]|uniref:DNA polymerase III, delta prime subunit n=1 Tax=Tistlia consotensis USBA 355 TaxID=560819 RepID=A0A1Y6CPJ2_9PROT|nr:DNA polymerase III subunit delta' [Tistlia consotensis]SMF68815.1 DNA polymerase III, delta prime subunit [Tistlia consotensis USBA 355]SNS01420.1 DNA polymerase III, delta prime subunit [Tistlia consotensis]